MPGLAHKIGQTIAAAGADLSFFVVQAMAEDIPQLSLSQLRTMQGKRRP